MSGNDHARECDGGDDDYAGGKPLPAFLKVAFVLCNVKIFVLKLIHLGAYYITYSHIFFDSKIVAFFALKK